MCGTARLLALAFGAALLLAAPGLGGPQAATPPQGKTTTPAPKAKTAPPAAKSTKPAAPPSKSARPPASPKAATFSFVCATPAVLLPDPVKQIVTQLTKAHRADGAHAWGDRAVSLRLRSDHAPVYFVPLTCGTTGNCTWGIVDSAPARSLGVFAGAVVQVETGGSGWPAVQVFTSGSDGQSRFETFRMTNNQYRSQSASSKPAATTVSQLQSCLDNASCCPRQGGPP
jgi:hypothetical protein